MSKNQFTNCHFKEPCPCGKVGIFACDCEEPSARPPRILVAYGTRPERIKLEPVIDALYDKGAEVVEWFSGQSRDLVECDGFDEDVVWKSLADGISRTMLSLEMQLKADAFGPIDAVVVQGDTATAFACAQAAFLAGIPVAHVEAGLRTYADEPHPEEAFRRQITCIARWHFAPDADAARNVLRELGGPRSFRYVQNPKDLPAEEARRANERGIFITGNPVIDTLPREPFRVLVTLHRRENWGRRIEHAITELNAFAREKHALIRAIQHPNWGHALPHRPGELDARLERAFPCIEFIDPLPHDELLNELQLAQLIVTDSGGLQEEAAHFGVPVLVLRTSTERTALARTGAVQLIDPDSPTALRDAIEGALARRRCYGDGTAGVQIADVLLRELGEGATHA